MIDFYEAAELAAAVLKMPPPDDDSDIDILDAKLYEELDVDLETFHRLVERLAPFCASGNSAVTNRPMKGFATGGVMICKVDGGS